MYTSDIDWSPTVKLGHDKMNDNKLKEAHERMVRSNAIKRKRAEAFEQEQKQKEELERLEDTSVVSDPPDNKVDKMVETEHTGDLPIDFFSEDYFTNDDNKVCYYTGLLNREMLLSTFELVIPFPGLKRDVYWRSFIITLMKLRLNLGYQDLAYRLGIPISTISRHFQEMLDIMAVRLDFLISWPDREELRKTMPLCFRPTYGSKVVAIIDCYEIKIERPSNLAARGSTWSQYKHSNTVKVLIAIAPQGVTTFVSASWGGRVSDKQLTRECGIIQKLLPGDIVLADRGFDIAEDIAMVQASLHIPAFTKGVSQLPPKEVESTRKLANLRIHVERVIGATRQRYSILMSTLPIHFMTTKSPDGAPTVDKIVRVCSALNNLCVSVVPFS